MQVLQNAIKAHGININVQLFRMYGEKQSAGFAFYDSVTNEKIFVMDMEVNRFSPQTKIYEIGDLRFCGSSPTQIIADKISVVSSDKVFRRIKDVIDLYYLSNVIKFNKSSVMNAINACGRTIGSFDGFLNRTGELRHSYERFVLSGSIRKPSFDDVYITVKEYISDFLPRERIIDDDLER